MLFASEQALAFLPDWRYAFQTMQKGNDTVQTSEYDHYLRQEFMGATARLTPFSWGQHNTAEDYCRHF